MDQQQHPAQSPQQHYEQLLVEAVDHAPTSVQQAVAAVLGHHGLACDSDSQVHNEDLCDAESQRRRAETAEADCEWYKRRVVELEQAKKTYAARLNLHRTQLTNYARYTREQAAELEGIAHDANDLLSNHGDQDRV